MKEDASSNIFDEASRLAKNKKKVSATKQTRKIIEKANPLSPLQPTHLNNPEVEALLAKASKYHEDIVNKLDMIQKEIGMSIKDVKEFLNNPSNFKPEEWQVIQQQRIALEENLFTQIGGESVKKEIKKKQIAKSDKERKNKTLGARKKWIPIR
jgi:hypothetical protein